MDEGFIDTASWKVELPNAQQGLKPSSFAAFTARLKSCPDTKRFFEIGSKQSDSDLRSVARKPSKNCTSAGKQATEKLLFRVGRGFIPGLNVIILVAFRPIHSAGLCTTSSWLWK
jgi:hypothetical protein